MAISTPFKYPKVISPQASVQPRLATSQLLGHGRWFALLHTRRRPFPAFARCNLRSTSSSFHSFPGVKRTASLGLLHLLNCWCVSPIDLFSFGVDFLPFRDSVRSVRILRGCSPERSPVGTACFWGRWGRFCQIKERLRLDVCHFFLGLLNFPGTLLLLSLKQPSRLDRSPRQWLEKSRSFDPRFWLLQKSNIAWIDRSFLLLGTVIEGFEKLLTTGTAKELVRADGEAFEETHNT